MVFMKCYEVMCYEALNILEAVLHILGGVVVLR